MLMNIDCNNDAKAEMERTMSLNEDVPRMLTRASKKCPIRCVPRPAVIVRTVVIAWTA